MKHLLHFLDAAEFLGISTAKLCRARHSGAIRPARLNPTRYSKRELERYAASKRIKVYPERTYVINGARVTVINDEARRAS